MKFVLYVVMFMKEMQHRKNVPYVMLLLTNLQLRAQK